jgi:hypothetical protein
MHAVCVAGSLLFYVTVLGNLADLLHERRFSREAATVIGV